MKNIIIATPTTEDDGIGVYSKIKHNIIMEMGHKCDIYDISKNEQYIRLSESIRSYKNKDDKLYVFLEFEMNVLKRKRPIKQLESLFFARSNNVVLAVMFHELWYKTSGNFIIKTLKSYFKRQILKKFILKVNPEKVFTNSLYNKKKLKCMGVQSHFTRVYSNIRVSDFNKSKNEGLNWLHSLSIKRPDSSFITGIVFGVIDESWEYVKTLKLIKNELKSQNKDLLILYVGPYEYTEAFKEMQVKISSITHFNSLGKLSEEEVCLAIAASDFGFCTTPLKKATRSGSLAALLEGDLPVIISDNEFLSDYDLVELGLESDCFWDYKSLIKEGFNIPRRMKSLKKSGIRNKIVIDLLDKLDKNI